MRTNIVFTLTGKDRVGIVEHVTRLLLDLGGNVEASRMTRLGGEFAVLALVSMPQEQAAHLAEDVAALTAQGFTVTTSQTETTSADLPAGWRPYTVEVLGADHEGIIHEVARSLAKRGINIESMETETSLAPVSGSPLFKMDALVSVPPGLAEEEWAADLEETSHRLNVQVKVAAAARP